MTVSSLSGGVHGRSARGALSRGQTAAVIIDLSPLRRSADLRWLVIGELISILGTQLTTVAVPYQVSS